eukprot:1114856-Pyramimonas_sp.AAC.1
MFNSTVSVSSPMGGPHRHASPTGAPGWSISYGLAMIKGWCCGAAAGADAGRHHLHTALVPTGAAGAPPTPPPPTPPPPEFAPDGTL